MSTQIDSGAERLLERISPGWMMRLYRRSPFLLLLTLIMMGGTAALLADVANGKRADLRQEAMEEQAARSNGGS